MNAATALAQLEQEGAPALRRFAQSAPAKVVASMIGMTPRHVYNLREGECGTDWQKFMLAAMHDAGLRDLVGRWLGFTQAHDPRALDTLRQIKALAASLPEEGASA